MLHIGCHLSSAKGFLAMGRQALALNADTFQFFTRNPRGSRAKALDPADAAALMALLAENRFAPIIAHAPYILNLCGGRRKTGSFPRNFWRTTSAAWNISPASFITSTPAATWARGSKRASPT